MDDFRENNGMCDREIGIIIPYYHSNLTSFERISFVQCMRILSKYDIILLVPDSMSEEEYPNNDKIIIEKVPAEWLQSISTYNEMMLNIDFYKRFQVYKYILIYQLDAFVFSDELKEFCDYGYDYIGAPWLSGYFYYKNEKQSIWKVGNGGFSLRKVLSFIRLLSNNVENEYQGNEDFFYSISASENFKVAPLEVALRFAFEREVKQCYERNNRKIPFGCHAWEKYDIKFWTPFIENFGYCVNLEYEGNVDEKLKDIYLNQRKITNFWENKFSIYELKNKLPKLFCKHVKYYNIWGAGYYGKIVCRMLQEAKIPIKKIIDSNSELLGKKIVDIIIEGKSSCILEEGEVLIIAIKKRLEEIDNFLKEQGYVYKSDYIYLDDLWDIFNSEDK